MFVHMPTHPTLEHFRLLPPDNACTRTEPYITEREIRNDLFGRLTTFDSTPESRRSEIGVGDTDLTMMQRILMWFRFIISKLIDHFDLITIFEWRLLFLGGLAGSMSRAGSYDLVSGSFEDFLFGSFVGCTLLFCRSNRISLFNYWIEMKVSLHVI